MAEIKVITYFIDDDRAEITLAKQYFANEKYVDIHFFADAKELNNVNFVGAAVAVIDYYLNDGLNGVDVAKMIKAKSQNCKIIIVSSTDEKEVLKSIIKLGARFVDKNQPKQAYLKEVSENLKECKQAVQNRQKDIDERAGLICEMQQIKTSLNND